MAEHLVHYPAVVISANEDVKAVAPEVIRRTVICRVQAGLTNTEVMKSSVVRTVQREIGTAFYREYLRRMFLIVPDLIDELKADDTESAPDILAVSSQILLEIISEFAVSSRINELRYNAGTVWEADRILKELPETLEVHKSRDWLVMNLEEAKEFFGLEFKKSPFAWLNKK